MFGVALPFCRSRRIQRAERRAAEGSDGRFDIISNMSNPALQVVLEGMKTGGSDAAEKEKATAPIKPWGECNYLRKSGTLYFAHLWVTALIFWILALRVSKPSPVYLFEFFV